jgi:hypothetical protein
MILLKKRPMTVQARDDLSQHVEGSSPRPIRPELSAGDGCWPVAEDVFA